MGRDFVQEVADVVGWRTLGGDCYGHNVRKESVEALEVDGSWVGVDGEEGG